MIKFLKNKIINAKKKYSVIYVNLKRFRNRHADTSIYSNLLNLIKNINMVIMKSNDNFELSNLEKSLFMSTKQKMYYGWDSIKTFNWHLLYKVNNIYNFTFNFYNNSIDELNILIIFPFFLKWIIF